MKQILIILIAAIVFACDPAPKQKPMAEVVDDALKFSTQQYCKIHDRTSADA